MKKYAVKIYKNDVFIGFVKSIRKHRNGFIRFVKTRNVETANTFSHKSYGYSYALSLELCLTTNIDKLMYRDNYKFLATEITKKDIRSSKLSVLKYKKIKTGILKNKEL